MVPDLLTKGFRLGTDLPEGKVVALMRDAEKRVKQLKRGGDGEEAGEQERSPRKHLGGPRAV